MNLQRRIDLLSQLGDYMVSENEAWKEARQMAAFENPWFTPEFSYRATRHIATAFLSKPILEKWVRNYGIANENPAPANTGIVMAGNIPLVGFHDLLSVFISGNKATIKPSSKDKLLIQHLTDKLIEWDAAVKSLITFADMLKGSDAYIATGSNNSNRYFKYYFQKYPHIIRANKTSVAILTGKESQEEMEKLADDVYLYFGLGCRNVTKIFVPENYDFVPLLEIFKKYNYLSEHNKYKNNYDYNLALHILNKKYYMTNGSIILVEEPAVFSPISQLNYEFYTHKEELESKLKGMAELQCIVGDGYTAFGQAQYPYVTDYADGVDTMAFLVALNRI
jgi:hypothetical protein